MPELYVTSQTVEKVLALQEVKYVIPEYQRPYRWGEDQCTKLWEDIQDAFEENPKQQYYLGTVVTYNSKNEKIIIDGQQRITTLLLLLRAFYSKLENMVAPETAQENIAGVKKQIEPCIWEINRKSLKVSNRKKLRIVSKVITSTDQESLSNILETGEVCVDESNYTKNYALLYEKCEEYATNQTLKWDDLCLFILKNCILMPIECEKMDTALTIFSTLNDRGLSLSDTDIFKSQIYKKQTTDKGRRDFISKWKQLEEGEGDNDQTKVNMLFRFYTHYLRGKDGITEKEVGIRKYYAEKNYARFNKTSMVDDLLNLQDFWRDVFSASSNQFIEASGRRYLRCLSYYPNDFWCYMLSVFFLTHNINQESAAANKKKFRKALADFLPKLTVYFYVKFIINPTVNAVKSDVYRMEKELCKNNKYQIKIKLAGAINSVKIKIEQDDFSAKKLEKGLLLLYCYLKHSNTSIPEKFEIEHIFPTQWKTSNYKGWTEQNAQQFLQNIGNKMVIEKRVNIKAGNGYFGEKKKAYKESGIKEVKAMSKYKSDDWLQEDIEKRKGQINRTLLKFFKDGEVFVD